MTLETDRQSFRGVVGLHCKAPIPVPAIVRDIQAALLQGSEGARDKSRVFNLRCPICHKEKPYRSREIVSFEGTPVPVGPFLQPGSIRPFQEGQISRTAKA
ncbi:MAG: hypothetical protein ACRD4Y_05450 [Candidatus Acidiferrales bacterium]